ncbi:MAG: Unknown protein [uncultured Campylobacterales bacterium]|uniref:Uncharacterized protein n=1 Tax=uncultured Campylobacterales bacterium TaxID=352960 RepID=A0A6S6T9F1_9BACT|nr:MAG: Unknown protein [uncultured Campylobacterales bacterium]
MKDLKMAEISYAFSKCYKDYFSTFKETSIDDNNKDKPPKYLCTDESVSVINFDEMIKDKYPNADERPQSFDAIYIFDKKIYCIEFKNEKKPNNKNIVGKLVDGKKELDIILGQVKVQKNNYQFIYCVVHKNHKPKYTRYKSGIIRGQTNFALLKYKENKLIDDVFVEDVSFFTNKFQELTLKELIC